MRKVKKLNVKAGSATSQHEQFVKAARDLGTDESEDAFDKVLGKIASAPPPKTVQKRKRTKSAKRK